MRIIKPEAYMYPGDEAAIQAVNKVPGLSKLLGFITKYSVEKVYDMLFSSSFVKLTDETAPKIYGFYQKACDRFGLEKVPDIYVMRGYQYETTVFGIDSPKVLINSSVLNDIPEDLIEIFVSSDIAGIKAGHGKLNMLLRMMSTFGDMLPIPKEVITVPLMLWSKQKYYTYDRARMLYSDNFEAVTKLIGYGEAPLEIALETSIDDRIEQGREFLEIGGMQGLAKTTMTLSETKPWNTMRVVELNNWVESGMYRNALEELA